VIVMASINIGRDNADGSFRYKMPPLQTKIEGRGNGIKTVIVNMIDIAKALHIDPNYPTKYFGIELGAQSKYTEKTERAVVNGAHTAPDLAKLLDKFIQTFVLCPTCKLPEVKMNIGKSSIKMDCSACGYNGVLKTQHRLASYIVKNAGEVASKGKKKDRKKGKGKDDDEDAEDDNIEPAAAVEQEDDDKDKKKKKDKKDKEKGGKKKDNNNSGSDGEIDDSPANGTSAVKESSIKTSKSEEDVWYTDTSKEAQKARADAEFAEMKANAARKDIDDIMNSAKARNESADTPQLTLKIFLAQDRAPHDIVAEIKRVKLAHNLNDAKIITHFLEALYDSNMTGKQYTQKLIKYSKVLVLLAADHTGAIQLVNCIESLVGEVEPKLIQFTPHILQCLYEEEVLDEETILSWADSPPESSWLVKKDIAQQVRAKAKPFIQWLKTADDGDD